MPRRKDCCYPGRPAEERRSTTPSPSAPKYFWPAKLRGPEILREALGGPAAAQPIGAHSGPVSASFGSSLVKIGVGLASGVPTAMGVDRHTACWFT